AMNKFGDCEFVSGTNGNGFTTAEFELPDLVEQVNDDYAEAVKKAGISVNRYNSEEFMPAVVFASSDAGFCAASVYPVMKTAKGARIRVGQPLKADHLKGRANAGYAYFAAELPKVFAKFDDFAGSVAKMAGVMINYPKNAFINMCKAAKVPKKRAASALQNMLNIAGDSPMTMDDLYLFIMDIAAEAANEMEPSALIRLEDSLAKIAKMNWSEYDLVIDATW
ncbi:MAG: hypothetical protein K5981_08245, partial [Clostridia bacterium]|nr:hypothetical protein [Clostridia bacterium]